MSLGVRDHEQALRELRRLRQTLLETVGIELGEALVEDDEVGALQERTRHEDAAALAVRQLPPRLAHRLEEPRGHAVEEIAEIELPAHHLGPPKVVGCRRPAAAHQQIERERVGEEMVLMELRRGGNPLAPGLGSKRRAIEALQQQETGIGRPQAREERHER
jgi:hypothetical protein